MSHNAATSGTLDVVHVQPQLGDARNTSADISAARADLGYEPQWDVVRGLREQVAWHRVRAHVGV